MKTRIRRFVPFPAQGTTATKQSKSGSEVRTEIKHHIVSMLKITQIEEEKVVLKQLLEWIKTMPLK